MNNLGGVDAPGLEAMWDRLLGAGKLVYGIAVDDAHHFKRPGEADASGPGRGWVMVRARALTVDAILGAMEAGQFYASTGVELEDVAVTDTDVRVRVKADGDAKFRIEFVGEADGCCRRAAGSRRRTGSPERSTVRARVLDSNGRKAWAQPVFPRRGDAPGQAEAQPGSHENLQSWTRRSISPVLLSSGRGGRGSEARHCRSRVDCARTREVALTRSIAALSSMLFLWGPPAPAAQAAATPPQPATPAVAARPAVHPDTILYGVAYYHEYMPYERLDKDIELMTRAGITVVRVGESTWTSWEPREGEFQFEWMDRIVSKMQAAGIKVVMGTPTYSVPPWLYAKHPEIMVVPRGQVRTPREFYGMRQNMDISHPVYRQYSERIIRKIAERYGKHPGVIGWQDRQRDGGLRDRRAERAGGLQGVAEEEVRDRRGHEQGVGPGVLGAAGGQLGHAAAA